MPTLLGSLWFALLCERKPTGLDHKRPVCFKYIRGRRGHATPAQLTACPGAKASGATGCISSSRCKITRLSQAACEKHRLAGQRNLGLDDSTENRLQVHASALVEPDGIEPTTSCLQSTRSPN